MASGVGKADDDLRLASTGPLLQSSGGEPAGGSNDGETLKLQELQENSPGKAE